MKKSRVLMMIHDISHTGVARTFLTLLDNLTRRAYELHLGIVVDQDHELSNIPLGVGIHRLKKTKALAAVGTTKRLLNELRPDIVLSGSWNLNLILAFLKPQLEFPLRLILYEGSVASQSQGRMKSRSFYHWLCRRLYPSADVILGVSDYVCDDLKTRIGIPAEKLRRIYNPVDIDFIESECQKETSPYLHAGKGPHVIIVGRISQVKNHAPVVAGFPKFLELYPDGHLWILGEGILREQLSSLISQLNLSGRVHLVGVQNNPFVWMKHADLFVLPSLKEGLGNALIEAVACGCPVVSSCTVGGVSEVLKLCGMEDRLVDRWDWSENWLRRPETEVKDRLRQHFGVAATVEEYEQLFELMETRSR